MNEPTASHEPRLPPEWSVDDLAEEFVQRWRDGQRPSIEEYVVRYPQWAADIRDVFPALIMMEELKPRADLTDLRADSPHQEPIPQRLGDYRIVRELGRGGMGIVYEAEHEALERRVALKVLSSHLLPNEKLRQRFGREAQAAARLHHTNIVPVFGVGEQGGRCFYVMQLIEGEGLDAILRKSQGQPPHPEPPAHDTPADGDHQPGGAHNPTPVASDESTRCLQLRHPRSVAKIGLQVAEALAYAHAQGVLHRDIKPSNLLLDARNNVWITDFGVAKLTDGSNLTQTGDIVGTLKYMSPERFNGESDERGDIYSLGITLYEMLTGQSAFPDTSPQQLIQLVTNEGPAPLRKLVRGLPRDLETIILKAIARDASHRYQRARSLAEDLRRYLEDRPIKARRTTGFGLLWRWCKRNPVAAGFATIALVLLVLVAVVSTIGYFRTAAANTRTDIALEAEKHQRQQAEFQREQAEKTSAKALEALNKIYQHLAPNRMTLTSEVLVEGEGEESIEVLVQPMLSRETAPLLEELLEFYEDLAKQTSGLSQLRRQAAEANYRIGDIRHQLGQYPESLDAYRRAVALYQELREEEPDDVDFLVRIARGHNEIGRINRSLLDEEEELSAHRQSEAVLERAPESVKNHPNYRYELARTQYFLARVEGIPPGASRGRGAGPGRGRPGLPGRSGERARGRDGRGRDGRGRDGRGFPLRPNSPINKAISILQELTEQHPTVPDYRHLLACCYRDIGWRGMGNPRPGELPMDRAIKLLEQLWKDFPNVPDYQYDLCETYARATFSVPFSHGRSPEPVGWFTFEPSPFEKERQKAKEQLEKALALSKSLTAKHPNEPHYAALHAQVHHTLGKLLAQEGDVKEAEKLLRRAVSLQTALNKGYPRAMQTTFWLAVMQTSLARFLAENNHWQEARAILETSAARQSELLKQNANREPQLRFQLHFTYRILAQVLTKLGEEALAGEATRKADQQGAGWLQPPSNGPGRRGPRGGEPPRDRQ